jgi:4-carboxymuconolactone decarboxylase
MEVSMRLRLLCAACFYLSLANAQKPTKDNLGLVGDRFKPLTYAEMTPAQKTMIDHLLAGERGGANGPFNVLLRSPEVGDLGQEFGAQMRFHSALPAKSRETVIITTARYWSSQYEWTAHKRLALQAGVPNAIVDAIAAGKRPQSMEPDVAVPYTFIAELLKTKQVSDANFQAAKERYGEKGVVDIICLSGWYHIVSMALNVDRYPLANGQQPELHPLANPIP